ADYQTSCVTAPNCPVGPLGERLECEPTTKRCLPAAACVEDTNCCGTQDIHGVDSTFRCDAAMGVCRAPGNACTPPASVTQFCPYDAPASNDCGPGQFCTL